MLKLCLYILTICISGRTNVQELLLHVEVNVLYITNHTLAALSLGTQLTGKVSKSLSLCPPVSHFHISGLVLAGFETTLYEKKEESTSKLQSQCAGFFQSRGMGDYECILLF